MTDVGQRVVRDLRDELFRHILNQSAGFFSRRTSGQLMSRITNDVQQIQVAVSETVGDLLREGLSVVGFACLMFFYDCAAGARRGHRRADRRLPAGAARPARAPHEPPRAGRAGVPVAHHDRGLHRSPHRQGVRRRGARGVPVSARLPAPVSHQSQGDEHGLGAAAAHGVPGRRRRRRADRVRQPTDRPRRA